MTMAAPETIEVEDLSVTFAGGVQAVAGVSLALALARRSDWSAKAAAARRRSPRRWSG